jgi:predicted ATPase
MTVRILGPVEVDGVPVTGREASVLAVLALRAPRAVSVDELIDAVWGEQPPMTAPKSLQNAISKLRREAKADIETVERGYRLRAEVDVHAVDALAQAGRAAEALGHWRGEPTAVPVGDRARLEEVRAALEDDVAEAHLRDGRADEAVALLEAGVAAAPYREHRWALLVRALGEANRQADALRVVQRARRVLGDEVGLEPGPELLDAERSVLERPDRRPVRRTVPTPSTAFVGRDAEVEAVRAALAEHRVVTLVGPGGVGKTRLAIASAPPDAVYVDLAPVAAGGRVWETVAAAAGIPTEPGRDVADTVVERLADGVVVLDNCEHLLDGTAAVAAQLAARVLATSREPLGINEERVVPVPALAVDDAVRLFRDRAAAAGAPPQDDVAAITEVCERLDRLPLAIELAAVRAPALGAAQLAARLDDRFALLDDRARRGEPRHRALRAVVDWSWELLDADERALFTRVSVFRAPFSLEDAEAVAADDALPVAAVAPAMTRLVRASMVSAEARDGGLRYRLLETFRDYAAARLDDPMSWRARHLAWVAAENGRAHG